MIDTDKSAYFSVGSVVNDFFSSEIACALLTKNPSFRKYEPALLEWFLADPMALKWCAIVFSQGWLLSGDLRETGEVLS